MEQSSTFRRLQSECCLFVKLKGKPSKLFCFCGAEGNKVLFIGWEIGTEFCYLASLLAIV